MKARSVFFTTLLLAAVLVASQPAQAISNAELDQASREHAAQVEAKYGLVTDPNVLARVNPIFARVQAAASATTWPLQLRVLNDATPNAFSLPNGQMYVNVGLLNMGVT